METHGSETYFVIGEGLLDETIGGRNGHVPQGLAPAAVAASAVPPFRFSRLGPKGIGKQLGDPLRKKLGNAMAVGGGGAGPVPSGFTYLGQFLDHDLTFDKTTVMFGANISPTQMLDGRSPTLDLDSLYGAGPSDPESAKFYAADGMHLKTGKAQAGGGVPNPAGSDLPRGAGSSVTAKRRAIIPDPRNDENLAVAQTHCAMIRFHNKVVDSLPSAMPPATKFAKARELVIKHYQWMVKTDFLPRVCAHGVVNDVFNNGRKVFEVSALPTAMPTMPIEFSVACYRLGHSMVRPAYNWNKIFDFGGGALDLLFTFTGLSGDLGGSPRLPSIWIADFRRLYDFSEISGRPDLVVPANQFNRAMRIDTLIANPLKNLPSGSFGGPAVPTGDARANLAFRNLTRARMTRLATGQQMATFVKSKGVNITKLTKAQLRDGKNAAKLDHLTGAQRDALLKNTPLWFYILRESETGGGRLKGVGARVVAETFHRAIEGSHFSIVRDPAFKPTFGPNSSTFRMVDLLMFAFDGKKSLLAPAG